MFNKRIYKSTNILYLNASFYFYQQIQTNNQCAEKENAKYRISLGYRSIFNPPIRLCWTYCSCKTMEFMITGPRFAEPVESRTKAHESRIWVHMQ